MWRGPFAYGHATADRMWDMRPILGPTLTAPDAVAGRRCGEPSAGVTPASGGLVVVRRRGEAEDLLKRLDVLIPHVLRELDPDEAPMPRLPLVAGCGRRALRV